MDASLSISIARYVVTVILVLFTFAPGANAATPKESPTERPSVLTPAPGQFDQRVDAIVQQQRDLVGRIEKHDHDLILLRARFDTTTTILSVVAAFLAIVLAIGTIGSLVGYISLENS